MDKNDSFIKRIDKDNLNRVFLTGHIRKEIEIKNTLDEGIKFLKSGKYPKAVNEFDKVLFYDSAYGEALINKLFALKGEKHFVKALSYYALALGESDEVKVENLILYVLDEGKLYEKVYVKNEFIINYLESVISRISEDKYIKHTVACGECEFNGLICQFRDG